ncbi:hypothetical protein CXB77_08160 [Chromatium okenii]|uniref:Uncharacterized protein n=1 Tax=Chromatium okenii TaxID=61644 RepID=A0A2S7XSK7_9GAMM|nr:hypothetical protein CXB77_08160 [Chromatium okenii]
MDRISDCADVLMCDCPATASSDALALPVLNADLTAPDLAPPSQPLISVFPLVIHDTALVLEAGASGEALVHWHVEADDYIGLSQAFAVTSPAPAAVLRLRRVRADGGADAAAEAPVHLTSHQGSGDRSFVVGNETAQFEAELGLTNATGGWLLLARSNRLLLGAGTAPPLAQEMPLPHLEAQHRQVRRCHGQCCDRCRNFSHSCLITATATALPNDPRLDAPQMPLAPTFPLPIIAAPLAVADDSSSAVDSQLYLSTAPAIHRTERQHCASHRLFRHCATVALCHRAQA